MSDLIYDKASVTPNMMVNGFCDLYSNATED